MGLLRNNSFFISCVICILLTGNVSAEESSLKLATKAADAPEEKAPFLLANLTKLCAETYVNEATCPKDFCRLFCAEGDSAEKCTLTCEPRPCVELTADHCPTDTCQLLDGCIENAKHCYPKLAEEPATCGDLAYTGNLECCSGFIKRCGVEFFDGSCDMKAEFSIEGVPACIPCGNGICNQFENRCNCPEDC